MMNLQQCQRFLKDRGVELSEDQVGHLMDILQYLAIRVCIQVELERADGGAQSYEEEETPQEIL